MQSIIDMPDLPWILQGQFHNRINMSYYPVDIVYFDLQLRNRFIYGNIIGISGDDYARDISGDKGWADLTFNTVSGESYILNTSIDRLSMRYIGEKLWISVGRQRINWGQNFVWNPNDWFNNYSFFDFDYPERPGSDALRIQYFTGVLSSMELAVDIDSSKKITAAGLYKIHAGGYDIQFMAGILKQQDAGVGFGWSGNIGQTGFRGEAAYFHPVKNHSDTSGLFMISLGSDYMFTNQLMLQTEFLYSYSPLARETESFESYYQNPLTVKNISFTSLSFFTQLTYPVSPLINASFSAMYFPKIKAYYLGPGLSYSLADELDFSVFLQYFKGDFQAGSAKQEIAMAFIRFKYSF